MKLPTCDPMVIYIETCFFLNETLLIKEDSLKSELFELLDLSEEENDVKQIIIKNINNKFNLNVEREVSFDQLQLWIEQCFEGLLKDLHYYFSKGEYKKKAEALTWEMYQQLVKKQRKLETFLCERVDEKCSMTWMFYNERLHQYNIFNTVKDWNLL